MEAVGRALTVMFTVWVVLPHAFEAVMVYAVFGELTEGVPEIVPVEGVILRPVGSVGFIEYVIGEEPVIDETEFAEMGELTQVVMTDDPYVKLDGAVQEVPETDKLSIPIPPLEPEPVPLQVAHLICTKD